MYLDLYMLLNFGVDYLLLLGTQKLSGTAGHPNRLLWAAVLGAVYSGLCLVPGFSFLAGVLWRLVFLGLISAIAFGVTKSAWRRCGIFTVLSLALGGMASLAGSGHLLRLLACGGGLWLLCSVAFGGTPGKQLVPLVICQGEKRLSLTALKDTGNSLRDPITGEQVLVLGCDQATALTGLSREQLAKPMETLERNPDLGLRLVPYHAVGKTGLLLAMRMGEVCWDGRKRGCIIAFAPNELGGEEFQALLGGMA